jgi:hypothetical protein
MVGGTLFWAPAMDVLREVGTSGEDDGAQDEEARGVLTGAPIHEVVVQRKLERAQVYETAH